MVKKISGHSCFGPERYWSCAIRIGRFEMGADPVVHINAAIGLVMKTVVSPPPEILPKNELHFISWGQGVEKTASFRVRMNRTPCKTTKNYKSNKGINHLITCIAH